MGNSIPNLKAVADYFGITNKALAKAINVDQSVVSRWMTGKRQLRVSSGMMEPIADFILSRQLTSRDMKWLKKHFEKQGLITHFNSASDLKMNLIIWLAADGMEILNHLGKNLNQTDDEVTIEEVFSSKYQYSIGPAGRIYSNDYSVKAGTMDIVLRLERVFSTLAEGSIIDICLSSEDMSVVIEDAIVNTLVTAAETGHIHIRMLISISSNSLALSKIISSYMCPIVKAKMKVYVAHGMMQPMINQMTIFVPDTCAAVITELPNSYSPPAALFITEEAFLKDAKHGFERTVKYAQPLMTYYNDNMLRSIIEIFCQEFSEPGDLDILNDSLNPLMMEKEDYTAFLNLRGHKENAVSWRAEAYIKLKEGFEDNLRNGTVFREIISLELLKEITLTGKCSIPAPYFMETGALVLDTAACMALLKGYIKHLKAYPNYNLAIAEKIDEQDAYSCRHMKHSRHVAINGWKSDEPILVYSDRMILLHEFQTHFNRVWMCFSLDTRENTIAILDVIIEKLAYHNTL